MVSYLDVNQQSYREPSDSTEEFRLEGKFPSHS